MNRGFSVEQHLSDNRTTRDSPQKGGWVDMKWDNEEIRYPHIETDEEKAKQLAFLQGRKRKLQQEQFKLCNLIFPERRRKIAVGLSLIQRQIDLREKTKSER